MNIFLRCVALIVLAVLLELLSINLRMALCRVQLAILKKRREWMLKRDRQGQNQETG